MILPDHISIADIPFLLSEPLQLSDNDHSAIAANAAFLDKKLKTGETFYGINTGFGSLCDVRIDDKQLSQLQENLVTSHSCGFGAIVPEHIVRLMILLKLQNIAQGHSGVQPSTTERLVQLFNHHITPVVYEQGSLGASGDLAPLAHMALPVLGLGKVFYKNKEQQTADVYAELGWQPLRLKAKEGLGMLNGTQFMAAYGAWCLHRAQQLLQWADLITAMSIDAFNVKESPFLAPIHHARPHPGQIATASNILDLLQGSELQQQYKAQVQDPYAFRCVPQVHGASRDAIDHIVRVWEIEMNATTDNPLIFEETDQILSGGNFHGQPLAINLDYMAIAMAELASISERRTYLLVSGQRGLPPFLAQEPGLNSGMMIAQYTAASIVSQNKQLCTPASVDSIVSSNGQEDHVSMGANAATKMLRVIENVQRVLAIELLCAAQALDYRRPMQSSAAVERLYTSFRKTVSFNDRDRILHTDMVAAEEFLNKDFHE